VELRPLLLAAIACSGSKTKIEDAKPIVHPADAAVVRPDAPPPGGKGDASVRIEWHDVPLAARAPGPCGPEVAPTTTWGIPDVVVSIDVPRAGPAPARSPRVVLDRCFHPAVQLATTSLTIASNALQPAKLALARDGGAAIPVELPIAGHEVAVTLDPGRYTLTSGAAKAWVVAAPTPFAAVTDATGVAVMRDVPSGTYAVTAWSPGSGRSAKGEVTVVAGQLAEVTLQLQP